MRAKIKEYQAVEKAAMNFVKSVAEGNSKYAKNLFIDYHLLLKDKAGWKIVAKVFTGF